MVSLPRPLPPQRMAKKKTTANRKEAALVGTNHATFILLLLLVEGGLCTRRQHEANQVICGNKANRTYCADDGTIAQRPANSHETQRGRDVDPDRSISFPCSESRLRGIEEIEETCVEGPLPLREKCVGWKVEGGFQDSAPAQSLVDPKRNETSEADQEERPRRPLESEPVRRFRSLPHFLPRQLKGRLGRSHPTPPLVASRDNTFVEGAASPRGTTPLKAASP